MATQPLTVVIFGASGDLTARKLIPALYNLARKGRLPAETRILGTARREYSDDQFREMMKKWVSAHKEEWDEAVWNKFAARLHYVAAEITEKGPEPLQKWFDEYEGPSGGRRLYYLSVKPDLYPDLSRALGAAGFNKENGGYRRLIVEKPFGHDLGTATKLNEDLHENFREDQIYRIDHYLGKDTVQNIMVFRFANTLFEPLWNYQYIDHVQITVAETVTAKDRVHFYDTAGVLRDMIQSHLLQVMTLVAMESPTRYNADNLRNEKLKVLDCITVPTPEEAKKLVAVGQYKGYRDELKAAGLSPNSKTPTFAAVRLNVENGRWKNVPFYIRSGKGLAKRYSEIMIQFRCPPHLMFPLPKGEILQCNRMTLVLQPNEGIALNFQTKVPDVDGVRLRPRDLAFDYRQGYEGQPLPEAYERMLLDAIQGDASLFLRADEIERAWAIMDPIIAATENADAPQPEEYTAGSDGPSCSHKMLEDDGRKWQPIG
jgi:glucose-6-phosphate 1-dehydrogenase